VTKNKIYFDFETYSECDLKKHGAFVYAQHPSTRVVCMAYGSTPNDVDLFLPHHKAIPAFLQYDPNKSYNFELNAWNSFFEFVIWKYTLKLPIPPFSFWNDTMAKAAAMSLPMSLAKCALALGLPSDEQKDKRGKYLINKLSKPRNGKRCTDPDLLDEFYNYCVQDVKTEMACDRKLLPLNPVEREVWIMDQEINTRGINVDINTVKDAIYIIDTVTDRMNAKVSEATLGKVSDAKKIAQIKKFLFDIGINMPCMDKNAVTAMLATDLPNEVRMILTARQQVGKTSLAKYKVLEHLIADDGRVHGLLQVYAASTGRWGGRMFQPQNMQRPSFDDTDECVEIIKSRDIDYLSAMYEDPMEALASCVRSMLIPSKGKTFFGGDYSAIEARCLAWMADDQERLEVFRTHGKIYEHTASGIYNVPFESVTKTQRFIGKVAELAMGYEGGGNAFVKMAGVYDSRVYDVNITRAFGEKIKREWRKNNPRIVKLWRATIKAAIEATMNPGTVYSVKRMMEAIIHDENYSDYDGPFNKTGDVQYICKKGFLFARLPSGRLMSYYRPHIKFTTVKMFSVRSDEDPDILIHTVFRREDWGDTIVEASNNFMAEAKRFDAEITTFRSPQLRYYGTNSVTRQWEVQHMHGGKIVENNDSAICRELLAWAMLRARAAGYDVVLTVHDEIVSERDNGSKEMFKEIMEKVPDWATGFPIQAVAFEATRYGKF